MADIRKSTKPRYDVLLAQLKYIKKRAAERLIENSNDKNDGMIDDITDTLGSVCMKFYPTKCPKGYHLEDGMCVAD